MSVAFFAQALAKVMAPFRGTGPYKPNGLPAPLPRSTPAKVTATVNRADSACDPDLWLWEAFFFREVPLQRSSLETYRGCIEPGWAERMHQRGFMNLKDTRKDNWRYPSLARQERAIKDTTARQWGSEDVAKKNAPASREWGAAMKGQGGIAKPGPIPQTHWCARAATRVGTGSIAVQTSVTYSSRLRNCPMLDRRESRRIYMRERRKNGLEGGGKGASNLHHVKIWVDKEMSRQTFLRRNMKKSAQALAKARSEAKKDADSAKKAKRLAASLQKKMMMQNKKLKSMAMKGGKRSRDSSSSSDSSDGSDSDSDSE